MSALGDDRAVVEYEDAIRVLDGAEAVRDNDDGAAFGEAFKGGLDLVLALGVECRGRFIEHDDRGVLEKGAGDGDALALSAGEA